MENTIITITAESINDFKDWLRSEERSEGTAIKYARDLQQLSAWLANQPMTRESLTKWKEQLITDGLEPVTINSKLAAVNTYCRYLGLNLKIKFLRIQRRLFREEGRELKKHEYERLIAAAAGQGDERLALLMETIASTGIRVSEVKYITVEAAKEGRAQIALKGKIRVILLPGRLCKKLLRYARQNKIASGEIFITKGGGSMSRKQIWAQMKALCRAAGVAASKVFPHNLRHLFARLFYKVTRDA